MTLEEWSGTEYLIVDWRGFTTRLRTFPLEFQGLVRYQIFNESSIRLEVDKIVNPRTSSNTSGSMRIELWALPFPYVNPSSLNNGFLMGVMTSNQLSGGWERSNIGATVNFSKPPTGDYYVVKVLRELMFDGYVVQDWRQFGQRLTILPVTNSFEIKGDVSYVLTPSNHLTLTASGIANQFPLGTPGVDLILSLWATNEPYAGGRLDGWYLGSGNINGLMGGNILRNFSHTTALANEPPGGTYRVVMALERRIGDEYFILDWVNFDAPLNFATNLSLSPDARIHGHSGASSQEIVVNSNTEWVASADVPWLTIMSGRSGSGNGVITYSVSVNAGLSRTGTITLSGGGRTATFRVEQTEGPPLPWDTGVVARSGNLRSLEWFGDYFIMTGNIIWHEGLGFLYVSPESRTSLIWLYDFFRLEWLATTAEAYPFLYHYNDEAWIWYLQNSRDPRRFFNFKTGSWQ